MSLCHSKETYPDFLAPLRIRIHRESNVWPSLDGVLPHTVQSCVFSPWLAVFSILRIFPLCFISLGPNVQGRPFAGCDDVRQPNCTGEACASHYQVAWLVAAIREHHLWSILPLLAASCALVFWYSSICGFCDLAWALWKFSSITYLLQLCN